MSENEDNGQDVSDVNASFERDAAWDSAPVHGDEVLRIDIDGFAGPLDMLLMLARSQKVDLGKISILALADQYIEFVARMREINLELAADYLVMASWLAYLKSRLLLPDDDSEDELSGDELVAQLAFRLQRLGAMRDVAANLMARNRLGRDIFARGNPEAVITDKKSEYQDTLYDLLDAYAKRRQKSAITRIEIRPLAVFAVTQARKHLEQELAQQTDWTELASLAATLAPTGGMRRSAQASCLSASLELVREGTMMLRQEQTFAPLFIKAKSPPVQAA